MPGGRGRFSEMISVGTGSGDDLRMVEGGGGGRG